MLHKWSINVLATTAPITIIFAMKLALPSTALSPPSCTACCLEEAVSRCDALLPQQSSSTQTTNDCTHAYTQTHTQLLWYARFFCILVYSFSYIYFRFSRCLLASTAHTLACFERSALSFTLEFCSCSNFINLIFIINDEYDRRVRQTGTPLEIVIPTP